MTQCDEQNEYVLHLMYASPVQRGGVSVLEDFPTIRDVKVELHVPEKITKVRLMPQDVEISFEALEDGYKVVVPEVTAHQLVVIEF